jgi:hypothetical protein
MNLEVLAWAPDKKTWEQAITTTIVASTGMPLASYARDMQGVQIMPPFLVFHPGLNVSEVGEIVAEPAVPNPDNPMEPLVPAVMVPGWHVNLRFHEPLAEALTEGLPQNDPETGALLPLFERTHFTTLFPDAVWHEDASGVPGGYVGTKGLKLFDPASVKSRSNVWA